MSIAASSCLLLAIVAPTAYTALTTRPVHGHKIPPPGVIHGLVKASDKEIARNLAKVHAQQAAAKANQTKVNKTKGKIPFADDIVDATQKKPSEIQAERMAAAKLKFNNEEGAKLRAKAKNMTKNIRRIEGICLKCKSMCTYFAPFCSSMCGLPCE